MRISRINYRFENLDFSSIFSDKHSQKRWKCYFKKDAEDFNQDEQYKEAEKLFKEAQEILTAN